VLTSEIMQLPNRQGYVKRATASNWQRTTFGYVEYAPRVERFVPTRRG
jgi:hypothetical protein